MAAILLWCSLDGHIHRKAVPHGLILGFIVTFPVSLAVYLVWTRGRRGILSFTKAMGLGVAVAFGAMVLGLVLGR